MATKGNKKPQQKTVSPAKSKAEASHTTATKKENFKFNLKDFIPLMVALAIFFFLWFKPYNVKLIDPWYQGIVLIDSANKQSDPILKNKLLDEAGKSLKSQVQAHPYHARVHHLYAYYWYNRQVWDSVIAQEKEAIRIGAGGIVNQVEYEAQNMMNSALLNKLNGHFVRQQTDSALMTLRNTHTPNMPNPTLDKYYGIAFARKGMQDSALWYYRRFQAFNPNDFDVNYNMAITFIQQNQADSARFYAQRALVIDPNNQAAQAFYKSIQTIR